MGAAAEGLNAGLEGWVRVLWCGCSCRGQASLERWAKSGAEVAIVIIPALPVPYDPTLPPVCQPCPPSDPLPPPYVPLRPHAQQEGMEIDRGYISPQFVNNNERLLVEYDNAMVRGVGGEGEGVQGCWMGVGCWCLTPWSGSEGAVFVVERCISARCSVPCAPSTQRLLLPLALPLTAFSTQECATSSLPLPSLSRCW